MIVLYKGSEFYLPDNMKFYTPDSKEFQKIMLETLRWDRLIISAHQPHFFPWAKYMAKIYISDLFISLDDYQFERWTRVEKNKIRDKKNIIEIWLKLKNKDKIEPINEKLVIWHNLDILPRYYNIKYSVLLEKLIKFIDSWQYLSDVNEFILRDWFYIEFVKSSDYEKEWKKTYKLVTLLINILKDMRNITEYNFENIFRKTYWMWVENPNIVEIENEVELLNKKWASFEERVDFMKRRVVFVNSNFWTFEYMVKDDAVKYMPPILVYDFEFLPYKQKEYKYFIPWLSSLDYILQDFWNLYKVLEWFQLYCLSWIRFKWIITI